MQKIAAAATDERVRAIGECGIDLIRCNIPVEQQAEILRRHIELSESLHKPLILHAVKGQETILRLHRTMRPAQAWIIHGFRGKPQQARQLTGAGLYLSIGEHFNPMSARAVPLDRLFVESDESQRPISEIYGSIAGAKGMTAEELVSAIRENTTIFGQF
jgi:TatD DNase family protein